jgi:hypothetical protein
VNWAQLWRLKIPPKVQNFAWRCFKNCLPVASFLIHKGVDIDPSCRFGSAHDEDYDHLFLHCEFSTQV